MRFVFILSCFVGSLGCAAETDGSMYLTGTEEFAIRGPGGQPACEAPKKVLVCHVPPGNPDNAHTICVGAAAVEPHQTLHGDLLGPCDGDGDDVDGGVEDEVDGAIEEPPTDPVPVD